ncbi:unnamed protein product [Phytophthora lilii]|uniref:Unnamed protein product n=1 Tax=Phytophthora lilii TaxID=2077276 RepID=A0A9W6XB20_9STRA|nr:unnamed protein product [Phytophthora lilii]
MPRTHLYKQPNEMGKIGSQNDTSMELWTAQTDAFEVNLEAVSTVRWPDSQTARSSRSFVQSTLPLAVLRTDAAAGNPSSLTFTNKSELTSMQTNYASLAQVLMAKLLDVLPTHTLALSCQYVVAVSK